jgi:uncharacterized membrane protein
MSLNPSRLSRDFRIVVLAATIYAIVMGTLGILQYQALRVPHGDSGMYEEHLWNFLHGKGFRSQIDDGRLFLGEHPQIIHLALIPIYVLWPTLETLQVVETVCLAGGAIAIFLLARTMKIPEAGLGVGIAYLLYFPLQHLNLEASWKTFRPEAFGVPLLFGMIWAMENRRWRIASLFLIATLCSKEDYGITTACLGAWLAAMSLWRRPIDREGLLWGSVWSIVSVGLVFAAVQWIIPYFRGDIPHFARYFDGLGTGPIEMASKLMTEPMLFAERLSTPANGWFIVLMIGPLLFVPLASPTRLAITLPTFAYLMLSSRPGLATPWFHFQAPLIPILFWATLAGIKHLSRWLPASGLAWSIAAACLISGFVYGRSPLASRFYDPAYGSPRKVWAGQTLFEPLGSYFRDVYLPDDRSRHFAEVMKVVKPTDRVAATDYARTRFTHFAAAYTYPEYRGNVTAALWDVIVIDRSEGWWGREPNNPDRELLLALARRDGGGPETLTIRGQTFRVVLNDPYWWVARQVRPDAKEASSP